ncbi:hypothetical protein NA56DRAFT_319442 [Hyaloscypha hepaticicola]|uniref:DUF676 domain-containing protein n=1 Tax=Hyaloscypha hepaticicola TaxID=2082293 RepID=A0A2J6PQ41_9HELO|nr:hypothetical protein NA56DRAFT_319442 [Hyaloscypha hepaticicola]
MSDFHKWADPGQTDIDIILVHGPGGGPERTWTDDQSGLAWPKDKLAPRFKNARILSFNYEPSLEDFFVLSDAEDSTMERIDNLSANLCRAVQRLEQYSPPKRLVFIAHSLGGLVCANILAKKTDQSLYSDLFEGIAGRCVEIVFLATPFCGNDPEAWEVITEKLCTNAKVERNHCSGAFQVQQAFQNLLANRFSKPAFRVENLVEAGDEDMPNVVVTADSAKLDSAIPVGVEADHQSISKCVDEKNLIFTRILDSLHQVEERAAPFEIVQYGHHFVGAGNAFSGPFMRGDGAAHHTVHHLTFGWGQSNRSSREKPSR